MVTGDKGLLTLEEIKRRKRAIAGVVESEDVLDGIPEPIEKPSESTGYVFDYDTGQFVPATLEQVAQREKVYEQFPEIAPPGTPGKITPQEYDLRRTQEAQETERIIKSTFPEYNQQTLTGLIERDFDTFIKTLRMGGSTPEKVKLLEMLGQAPEDIAQILGGQEQETHLITDVQTIFPDVKSLDEFNELIQNDPDRVISQIQVGGQTPEKLSILQGLGLTEQDISEIFRTQKLVVSIEGVQRLVNIDMASGRAYDYTGSWVGSWNDITHEFSPLPEESKLKDVLDATRLAFTELGHKSKQFFISTLPNILFRDLTDIERNFLPDAWVDMVNANNKQKRDNFRRIAGEANIQHEDWITKNPQLQPRPEWREGVLKDASVLKDPAYWVYEFASSAPFTLATMGAMLAGTAIGGPAVGIAAGFAVMTPSQAAETEELLLQYGAPEDKAALLGTAVGGFMSLIETAGDLPMFKMIAPKLFGAFRKNITDEVARATMRGLARKGLKTFGMVEITETLEEVAQQAVQNAALRTVKENQALFEGLDETVVRTLIATAPFALLGAGVAVKPQVKQAVSDGIEGLPEGLKEIIVSERGAIGKGKLPSEEWNKLPISERVKMAQDVGLEGKVGSKEWAALTSEEKQTLSKAVIPVEIPKAEALFGETEAGLQPEMFGAPPTVVRPLGKGKLVQISMEDQLKLEQARQATEAPAVQAKLQQTETKLGEVQAKIEGLETVKAESKLRNLLPMWKRMQRRKDQPADLTLKEYRDFTGKETPPATSITPDRKHVYWRDALDSVASEYGFTDTEQLLEALNRLGESEAKIKELRVQEAHLSEEYKGLVAQLPPIPALPALPEPTVAEMAENLAMSGQSKYTMEQIDALVGVLGEYVTSPTTIKAYEVVRELQRTTRAERFRQAKDRAKELIVEEGMTFEAALNQAAKEKMSGELPNLTTDYFQDMTNELRDAFFAKVYYTFNKLGPEYQGEMWSTLTALTNAIGDVGKLGKAIPTVRGKGSILFPRGGSAWDRLNYVFGDKPKTIEAIEKMASENKQIKDVVEGVFHEYVEGGRPPIPVDEKTAEYLRHLGDIPYGQPRLGETFSILPPLPPDTRTPSQKETDLQAFKLELTPDQYKDWSPERLEQLSFLRINLLKTEYQAKLMEEGWTPKPLPADTRTTAQKALDLQEFATELAPPPIGITEPRYEAPIEDAARQMEMIPASQKGIMVRALKEAGLTAVDIGNFLRANKASFDFSWWRQQAPLIMNHKSDFIHANIEAWKAMWNQKSAEASWERITRDPLYQIYEESGYDFLRPLMLPKGTAQWKGVEEYGYLGTERPIPRFTEKLPWVKLSQRAFVTGTNEHNWRIFRDYYNATLRWGEKIASGEAKLKEGEAFDLQKEMTAIARLLTDLTGRAKLGKASGLAPVLSAFFFAPRYKLGRILTPRHLLSANPRIRAEAWKDLSSFVGTTGGIIVLGALLGLWDVEWDKRSSDFMKIRVGNLRVDPWGGYQQLAVFVSRLFEKTGVSSITGQEYKADFYDILTNFIKGAQAPLASLILDTYTGKTFIGEELDIKDFEQWADRIAPMIAVDMYEAFKDSGISPAVSLPLASLGFLGAGIQAYTGDWRENFQKLGTPKYQENLEYGLTEPPYNMQDLWADHSADFKGVDPATLTEQKGFPEYIRSMARARGILEQLSVLPNDKLVDINIDATKGTTLTQYRQMWQEREKIVASGDEAKLKEFDQDDRTKNAYIGNIRQTDYALLVKYHSLDKAGQEELLKQHPELGLNPRRDWLRTHPKENAELALWGVNDTKILTMEAYNQFKALVKSLDIPENALPDLTLPPEKSVQNYFDRLDAIEKYKATSAEAMLILAKDEDLQKWLKLDKPEFPVRYYELKVKNRAEREYLETITDKDSAEYIADNPDTKLDEQREDFAKKFPKTSAEYWDDERRTQAIAKKFTDTEIEDWVERGRLVDKFSGNSPKVKEWAFDNPEAYAKAIEQKMIEDKGGLPDAEARGHYEKWVEPAIRLQAKNIQEDAYWQELGDKNLPDVYIEDEKKRREKFLKKFPGSAYFDDMERIEAYKGGFNETEANLWANRGQTIAKFSPNSAEAKVWLLDHPDVWKKALDAELLTDDGKDWNEPVIRITAKWREKDKAYQAILDKYPGRPEEEIKEAKDYLADNAEYRIARRQREAYKLIPQATWDLYKLSQGERTHPQYFPKDLNAPEWQPMKEGVRVPVPKRYAVGEIPTINTPEDIWRKYFSQYQLSPDSQEHVEDIRLKIGKYRGALAYLSRGVMAIDPDVLSSRSDDYIAELVAHEFAHVEWVNLPKNLREGFWELLSQPENAALLKILEPTFEGADKQNEAYAGFYAQLPSVLAKSDITISLEFSKFYPWANVDYLLKKRQDIIDFSQKFEEAYNKSPMTLAPEEFVNGYVEYNELPIKGFRRERYLIEHEDFWSDMYTLTGKDVNPEDVPDVRWDEITEANQDLFDKWEGYGEGTSDLYIADDEARAAKRAELTMTKGNVVYSGINFYGVKKLTNFGKAVYEREAYYNHVPEERVADYVAWKTIGAEGKPDNWELKTGADLWYEDDWFLMEHPDFYKNVYIADLDKDGKPDHERADFRKVPSREVFNKYLTYLTLPQGTRRSNFRFDNLDLDDWLVLKFGYKSITEQRRRAELTSTERALEDIAAQAQEWQQQLDEIEKILAGVG